MAQIEITAARLEGGVLTLKTNSQPAKRFIYEFKPGLYEITKAKKKRSLNANAYAWKLISKIGDVVRKSKEEVYKDMLKHYGQSNMVSVRSDVDVSRFFDHYDVAGESVLNGKTFTHYKVYTGSSEYDTREMSILIDGIVQEAKNLDIETLTPLELERMKEAWADAKENKSSANPD